MKSAFAPLLVAALCLSLLTGCSKKKPIVGKWQNDQGLQFEFTKDGKLVVTRNATYTLPDDGHYVMETDIGMGKKDSSKIAYFIKDDTMTLEEGSQRISFKRVK